MGYTHYWENNKDINTESWTKIINDFKKVLNVIGDSIKLDGCFKGKEVFISEEEICFNGVAEESCETFHIHREPTDFEFCKTRAKPYDLAVCSCLLITAHHCKSFTFSSDGDSTSWENAINLIRTTLSLDLDLTYFTENEEEDIEEDPLLLRGEVEGLSPGEIDNLVSLSERNKEKFDSVMSKYGAKEGTIRKIIEDLEENK